MRRIGFIAILAAAAALLMGCETGRNYQSDIDSLNSKISALQTQLSAKDDEIAKLRAKEGQLSSIGDQVSQLKQELNSKDQAAARAEEERKLLSRRLDEALAKLSQKQSGGTAKTDYSDLK